MRELIVALDDRAGVPRRLEIGVAIDDLAGLPGEEVFLLEPANGRMGGILDEGGAALIDRGFHRRQSRVPGTCSGELCSSTITRLPSSAYAARRVEALSSALIASLPIKRTFAEARERLRSRRAPCI